MRVLSVPPEEKVLEALSCIADGRITVSGNKAKIVSSTGEKEYVVELDAQEKRVKSTDPATRWQHYYGYPVIAFLMKKGKVSYDPEIASLFKGIPWKKWNEENKKKHGKDYHEASFKQALELAVERGGNKDEIKAFVKKVLRELEELGVNA